jgi:methionyl-tRNA formyltransferase
MKKISEPIIFFGSGPVAAASLEALAHIFTIEYVITKQVPPHHHGMAPVQELAEKLGLPLYFANTRAELDKIIKELNYTSRLGVIVDYGVIVSKQVIDAFPLGIINSHFSLLPEWRGADPITFTVLSGQIETGVSLMLIVEALDEGDLLSQEKISLSATITTPELTDELVALSNKMLILDIPRYIDGKLKPYPQPSHTPTYSRKLTKKDGYLDPVNKIAIQLEREIRAFKGWPKSRARLGELEVIITQAHSVPSSGRPGDIEIVKEAGVLIMYCAEGSICIERLKPAGKKEMSAADFIRGYGSRLGTIKAS